MNETGPRIRPQTIHELANELCKLFGEQFDALQLDLTEVELESYLKTRTRIHQLLTELKAMASRPS
jgi:hypothetical protein